MSLPTPEPGHFSHEAFLAGTATTSDLADLLGDDLRSCTSPLRHYGGRTHFAGRIRTIESFEDNSLLRRLLSEPGHGDVLVVDTAGSTRVAMMGDFYAAAALANGWAGVIVNGSIRDVRALGALDLGVLARGSNPRTSRKDEQGAVDVPVAFGDVTFLPGEHAYADLDGLVVTHELTR